LFFTFPDFLAFLEVDAKLPFSVFWLEDPRSLSLWEELPVSLSSNSQLFKLTSDVYTVTTVLDPLFGQKLNFYLIDYSKAGEKGADTFWNSFLPTISCFIGIIFRFRI
jgi:hypothetical protein